ncbi:hypothetical protein ACIRBX_23215 [Kitasatospora sp. NPDC096147]|uniref:hypothetical protein n=1 Tax=Kitasatospora sp. NPDC096147 TaxID=3364093 RepID=UPI00382EBAE1
MFRTTKSPSDLESVLLVREAPELAAALREALGSATEEQRAGLEVALAIVAQAAERPDPAVRGGWAERALAVRGLSPEDDTVAAVKAVREAAPALSLLSAHQLVQEARLHRPAAG